MFLNYSPELRHPLGYSTFTQIFPSLLTGFLGTDFPAFKRYYGDAKTAFTLLRPFLSRWFGYHLQIHPFFLFSRSGGHMNLSGTGSFGQGISCVCLILRGGGRLSHVPMHACCAFDIPRDPDRIFTTCLWRCIDVAPTGLKVNAPAINNLSRLKMYPFDTRCVRFMLASLPTMQHSLPVVDRPFRTGLVTCRLAARCFIIFILIRLINPHLMDFHGAIARIIHGK